MGQANLTGNMRLSCVSEHLQKSTQNLTYWVHGDSPQSLYNEHWEHNASLSHSSFIQKESYGNRDLKYEQLHSVAYKLTVAHSIKYTLYV